MYLLIPLLSILLFLPNISLANEDIQCSPKGYTITTINGVLTDDAGARKNKEALQKKLPPYYNNEPLTVDYLLNPSHIGGIGDFVVSAYQKYFDDETVKDYDLIEMLRTASEKVTTQKILLVAHSQGNFYANSFYDTMTDTSGSVPAESIGIYSVATPSSRVAGGGKWLTSDTDTVIADVVGRVLFKKIMRPNTHIELHEGDDSRGHSFSDVYLKYRGTQIISDIESSLDRLQANDMQDTGKPCIAPPELTTMHKIEGAALALADPTANTLIKTGKGIGNSTSYALAAIGESIGNIFGASSAGGKISEHTIPSDKELENAKSGAFGIASALYGNPITEKDLANDPQPAPQALPENPLPARSNTVISSPYVPPSSPAARATRDTSLFLPIAGVGAPTPAPASSAVLPSSASSGTNSSGSSASSSSSSDSSSASAADITAPDSPVITAPASDNQIAISSTIMFRGSAEASSTVSNNFSNATTTADGAGNWILALAGLSQGTTSVGFFAKDQADNISSSSSRTVFVDSEAPALSLNIAECTSSLATSGCLIATTTFTLSWLSPASDLASYSITCEVTGAACAGFSYATTTATSTIYAAPTDNTTYIFTAYATDIHGNTGAVQSKTITIATRPVVINEVAWAGTSAIRSEDEWMELYNPTDKDIDLSGWVLRSVTDNTPYIRLSGIIAHKGFFLLERTNDTTVSDIAANQIYTGSLTNSGEVLELSYSSTTIDKTPDVATCHGWCQGLGSPYYSSMERYDPFSADTSTNWETWSTTRILGNGKNADGVAISGTPGKRNGTNYLLTSNSSDLTHDKTLSKNSSPYIIASNLHVPHDVTLTVDPGVVVKFYPGSSSLLVDGALNARGSADEPVVFTSLNDDDCGIAGGCGDTNATTTPAAPGDWLGIKIFSADRDSTINHAIVRYGGKEDFFANYWANLRIENASTSVTNSVIEKSRTSGILMKNTPHGQIASNIIRENNRNISGQARGTGFVISSSSPAVISNQFTQNAQGLLIDADSDPRITANTFTGNIYDAIFSISTHPMLSGNTASGNGINGVTFQNGALTTDYAFSTDLPYYLSGDLTIPANKTLTIPPGAVVKMGPASHSSISVQGKIIAEGTADAPIIFTSLLDDTYGGDTNNDGSATLPAAGDWANITINNAAATSTFNHVIMRYGGNRSPASSNIGALRVVNSSADIRNAIIENSYTAGLWLQNSTSTAIADSVIQNHRDPNLAGNDQSYGIYMMNSSPSIKNAIFKNNKTAIFGDALSSVMNLGGITFEGNAATATPGTLIP